MCSSNTRCAISLRLAFSHVSLLAVWRNGTHICISQTMDDDEVESAADDEARAAVRRQPRQWAISWWIGVCCYAQVQNHSRGIWAWCLEPQTNLILTFFFVCCICAAALGAPQQTFKNSQFHFFLFVTQRPRRNLFEISHSFFVLCLQRLHGLAWLACARYVYKITKMWWRKILYSFQTEYKLSDGSSRCVLEINV